jgi:hypothetical protein
MSCNKRIGKVFFSVVEIHNHVYDCIVRRGQRAISTVQKDVAPLLCQPPFKKKDGKAWKRQSAI